MELRTVLIIAVVVLCIYIAWILMRYKRAHRGGAKPRVDRDAEVFRDVDRFAAAPLAAHADTPTLLPDDEDSVVSLSSRPASVEDAPAARRPRPPEPDASAFGFDALLEVRQTRHIVDELRREHDRLAEEVARLRDELAGVRAASRVAPAYAEAVTMVQRGLDAEAIAERCGISVAEAQLVRALSEQTSSPDTMADEFEQGLRRDTDADRDAYQGRRHE